MMMGVGVGCCYLQTGDGARPELTTVSTLHHPLGVYQRSTVGREQHAFFDESDMAHHSSAWRAWQMTATAKTKRKRKKKRKIKEDWRGEERGEEVNPRFKKNEMICSKVSRPNQTEVPRERPER